MHCLDQKKWRDPRDLARPELIAEIREITDMLKKSEFEIENYDAILTRYTESRKELDAIKMRQTPIYAELKSLRNRFLGNWLHRTAIVDAEERLAEANKQFERYLQKYHRDNPLLDPVDGSVIGCGCYEDYLCWTISSRAILPWDTEEKMIYGADVDSVYSYEKLMPAEVAVPWLIENEIEPLKKRLSKLKRQLEVRV